MGEWQSAGSESPTRASWNGSLAQLERPTGKALQLEGLISSQERARAGDWQQVGSLTTGLPRAFPPELLGLLFLLHKRVENSRFKQGCHSEMTARPSPLLPHRNHVRSLHSARRDFLDTQRVFGPKELVRPQGSTHSRSACPAAWKGQRPRRDPGNSGAATSSV